MDNNTKAKIIDHLNSVMDAYEEKEELQKLMVVEDIYDWFVEEFVD